MLPASLANFVFIFSILNFDFQFIKPGCAVGKVSWTKLYWATMLLFCAALLLAALASYRYSSSRRHLHEHWQRTRGQQVMLDQSEKEQARAQPAQEEQVEAEEGEDGLPALGRDSDCFFPNSTSADMLQETVELASLNDALGQEEVEDVAPVSFLPPLPAPGQSGLPPPIPAQLGGVMGPPPPPSAPPPPPKHEPVRSAAAAVEEISQEEERGPGAHQTMLTARKDLMRRLVFSWSILFTVFFLQLSLRFFQGALCGTRQDERGNRQFYLLAEPATDCYTREHLFVTIFNFAVLLPILVGVPVTAFR